jgi:4-aminobutyrate aminotransferase
VDGNSFLDFTAGIAVCSTGHCHPRVVQAIVRQSAQLLHMSGTDFYYALQRDLAQKLAEITPGDSRKRVFFTNSGTESVEAAIKLARYHTGRQHIVAFFGAFHGRTMGALSLTASKVSQRHRFAPLVPGVIHVPYADPYRCPPNLTPHECATNCVDYIQHEIFRRIVSPDEVAAIVVEPIQGEGGYIVPPPEFHPRLRATADKHGILYVVDEVQTGMGRTGKMFAIEHWGVEPDMICLAKGIASGMPLGALVAKESIMNWTPGSHASTFGGNPVSCAAALETIALLEEGLMENAAHEGAFLLAQLEHMAQRHASIGQVRGIGLMIGVDLVKDRRSKEPATELRDRVIQQCFHQGLLLLGCGPSTLRLCPPLVIDRQQAKTALAILDDVLTVLHA